MLIVNLPILSKKNAMMIHMIAGTYIGLLTTRTLVAQRGPSPAAATRPFGPRRGTGVDNGPCLQPPGCDTRQSTQDAGRTDTLRF